jgi:hypothetical protein
MVVYIKDHCFGKTMIAIADLYGISFNKKVFYKRKNINSI